jgi:hypothetical protein
VPNAASKVKKVSPKKEEEEDEMKVVERIKRDFE